MNERNRTYLQDEDSLTYQHTVSHGSILGEAVEDPADGSGDEEAHGGAGHSPEHLVVEGIASRQEYVRKQQPVVPPRKSSKTTKSPASTFHLDSPNLEKGAWIQLAMET